ncbi:hypothetical protein [Candidatus Chlamydia sanziniae]|uniref:Inclusion Membrane Protein C n=1 Tax=Candidatus Chlamydia sanziniae TaxID=1806891 RepID=A0A1A9HYB4_9CHLA|nr:hypothetical protein [Candidatus Chlamydia sanziniae]ANH79034.1 Inclusion Membrane Protein C [Candidatus Chlamydia sanziniae]
MKPTPYSTSTTQTELIESSTSSSSFGDSKVEFLLKEISTKLSACQSVLLARPAVSFPTQQLDSTSSPAFSSLLTTQQQVHAELTSLRAELGLVRTSLLIPIKTSPRSRIGIITITAILLAISLLAVLIIVLAVLGFTGILPQVALLLGYSDLLWATISGSIVFVISAISVISLIITQQQRPITTHTTS